MTVRVEEIDGARDLVMLLRELDASLSEVVLRLVESGGRDAECDVPHGDGVAARTRLWLVVADRKEGDRCCPYANDGREVSPDVLMETAQAKYFLVPLGRRADVPHQDGDVVDSLCHDHLRFTVGDRDASNSV